MRDRVLSLVIGLVVLVVFVGGWKLYVELSDVSRFVLPPPEDVATATWDLAGDGDTWEHLRVTLWEIVAGFAVASAFGVVTGIAIGEIRVVERALSPFLIALQVLPKVAVIPLLILWLGFGPSAKIVIAAIFAFFPVTAGTRAGIRSVERNHRDLATTLQASRWQQLRHIDLPSSLPSILTGMEVGIVLATVGAIVAEYLAGAEGLGYLATFYLNQLQVDALFGVIVVMSALGLLLYGAVLGLRRLLVPWHESSELDHPSA
ncbi:MAG TPA: ABC transporter permease [Acidimicrobiales bacterium]|nr:ABC transporter permease [Acidimicrobiales bacterium]